MKKYCYSEKVISKEYGRVGIGVALSLVPLLLLKPSSVILYLLGSVFCLFVFYGIRTFDRSRTEISVSDQEICSTGIWTKKIKWEDLESIKLGYFSTRRDGENGWMQLKLNGGGVRLRVESTINDFEDLVGICAEIASDKGLSLDAATNRNLRALGLSSFDPDLQNTPFSEKSS